ncbi:MAG: hypothetical protein ABWX96_07155 [Propionibacteriaceae bacterium]
MTVPQVTGVRTGFFSPRSLVGGIVVGAILLAFGVGLPWLARSLPGDDGFRAGQPYPVTTEVFITPAAGWVRDARRSDLGVTLTMINGAAEMTVYARQGGPDDVAAELDEVRATHATNGYLLTEPRAVQTPTGLTGTMISGSSTTAQLEAYVLTGGEQLISVVGTWPREQDLGSEVQAMTASLEVR